MSQLFTHASSMHLAAPRASAALPNQPFFTSNCFTPPSERSAPALASSPPGDGRDPRCHPGLLITQNALIASLHQVCGYAPRTRSTASSVPVVTSQPQRSRHSSRSPMKTHGARPSAGGGARQPAPQWPGQSRTRASVVFFDEKELKRIRSEAASSSGAPRFMPVNSVTLVNVSDELEREFALAKKTTENMEGLKSFPGQIRTWPEIPWLFCGPGLGKESPGTGRWGTGLGSVSRRKKKKKPKDKSQSREKRCTKGTFLQDNSGVRGEASEGGESLGEAQDL
ncbi:hypothetical protein P4O66_020147 [Electrophorus voltai]|uniref:Uncharacterized protein n=1 Tax=Electrophorus voltai TaxID=2609070 RepID=A0AAD8ZRI8_9TELE|nr:hypothetical protein P4O66_020147 [Electrophorus voltai]